MRTLRELEDVAVHEWTADEAFAHLCDTFDANCRQFPAIMEPYSILMGDASDDAARTEIMRRGLRETMNARHPMRNPQREAAE